jgi:23S rRNA pseudouridine1911/1915/1917 synthase
MKNMNRNLQILFEDSDILAINKPAGVVVNRAESYVGFTVQDWMAEYLKNLSNQNRTDDWLSLLPADFTTTYGTPEEIFEQRVGMVHRLDKDTSGVMLLAKNPGAMINLLRQFKERAVSKEYTCLTHGKFATPAGTIDLPLARRSSNRMMFGVVANGRPAVTDYQVVAFYANFEKTMLGEKSSLLRSSLYQGFSLVNCQPKTGRTHQIRVHMQHLQHPIVGDQTYVGKKRAKIDQLWCPRQFLHASKISLSHPRANQAMTIEAPLAEDLSLALRFLN